MELLHASVLFTDVWSSISLPTAPVCPVCAAELGREGQLPSAVNVPVHLAEWLTPSEPHSTLCLKSIEVYQALRFPY